MKQASLKDNKLACCGATGTVLAAICCFTPVLVVALGAIGLSRWLGWLDYVLMPALGFFVLLTVYALYRRRNPAAIVPAGGPEQEN